MNKKEFEYLVENKMITKVDFATHYYNDEEALSNLDASQLASEGILSQPALNDIIVNEGLSSIMPVYITNQSELEEQLALGGYIKLTNDIQLDTCIVFNGDAVLDLNGYSITAGLFTEDSGTIKDGESDSYAFWVTGGSLTIKGEGCIKTKDCKYSIAVWCTGGEVNIYGGSYYNSGDGCDLIYVSSKGLVNIFDGYFEATTNSKTAGTMNNRSALNIKDKDRATADIKVMGGSFLNFDPSNNLSEGANTNFVTEGYEVVVSDNLYKVVKISE